MNPVITIAKVTYVSGFKLSIEFSDGKLQIVDFGPFLDRSLHPEIRKYRDIKLFKKYKLENGDLMWGDFDLIFPIGDLYSNKIDHQETDDTLAKTKKAK